MTTHRGGTSLRLPRMLEVAAENLSKRDGTNLEHFVVMAVAEKVSAMVTADPFPEHKVRADMAAFERIVSRGGGRRPLPGDEQPRRP